MKILVYTVGVPFRSRSSVPVRPFNVPLSLTENIRMENAGRFNGTVRRTLK